ncbi:MAG: PAS domain S-box protein [Fidelibacterota bacterium]|nr:MAG: PAS domain S-box protein [Candidatus Neomarinimicrobiota bacterium]
MFNLPEKLIHSLTSPSFTDKESTRIAGRLNTLLLWGLALVAAVGFVNIAASPRPLPQFITICAILGGLLVNLLLYGKGYIRLVRLLFPITGWIIVTFVVLFSGGINSPSLAGYVPFILFVGLIYGLPYGIGATVISILTSVVILTFQAQNLLPEQLLVYRPISMWATYMLWFIGTAVLLYVSSREFWRALWANLSRLRSLFDTMSEGVVLINPDGQVIQANPAAERILGLKRSEIESRSHISPVWEVLRPDGSPMPPEERASPRAMKEKRPVNDVMTGVRRPDGSMCWINVSAAPIMNAAGKLEGVISTFADITTHKQTEKERELAKEALRESEERFRDLAELLPETIYEMDTGGNLSFVNRNALKKFKYTQQDFDRGLNGFDMIIPDDRPRAMENARKILSGEKTDLSEYTALRKDGSTFPTVFCSTPIFRDGKPIGLRGIIIDVTNLKHAEEALRESEEKYRIIYENVSDHIIFLDNEGTIISANDHEDTFGRKPEELVGRNFTEFGHFDAEDIPEVEKLFKEVVAGKRTINRMELEIKNKNGNKIPVEASATLVRKNGKIEGSIFMVRDITERKQAEEVLRKSEERYRTVVEYMPNLICRFLPDGMLSFVNNAYCQHFGKKYEELIGHDFFQFIPTEEREKVRKHYRSISKKKPAITYEHPVIAPDGTIRWQRWTDRGLFNESGALVEYQSIGEDITESKRAEEALAIERERLSTTLRGIGDGVITTNIEQQVVLINQAAETLTGWTQEEALGRPLAEVVSLIDESSGGGIDIPAVKVLKDQVVVYPYQNATLISKGNHRILVSLSISLLKDRESQVIGMVMVIRDITEKSRLESEMLRLAKLESLGVLASGLAHDFNNFLMSIMLNLSAARLYLRDNPKTADMLKDAEESTRQARGITQQLATFSRGDVPDTKSRYLTPILKEAIKFSLRGTLAKPRFRLGKELWPVEIDPGQINQVLNNLAINAVQAMPRGGTLTVIAANVTVDAEHPTGPLKPGQYVRVVLKDKGIGIPPESLDKIFDPYFTTKEAGSGLGLFSVYSIIKKHNGWITVDSKLNKGTSFTFYLPAVPDTVIPPYSDEGDTMSKKISGTGRILVMDDDELIRKALARLLDDLGFEIVSACGGSTALKLFKEAHSTGKPFKGAILDFSIPGGMGGVETLKSIREIDPEIKAIVTSGYANAPIIAHCEDYGFQGRLAKPFTAAELFKVLEEVFG